jgi:hypothetical protein
VLYNGQSPCRRRAARAGLIGRADLDVAVGILGDGDRHNAIGPVLIEGAEVGVDAPHIIPRHDERTPPGLDRVAALGMEHASCICPRPTPRYGF